MLIQNLVVEASIAHGEASKLTSVPVAVSATFNSSGNEPVLQKLLIKEASVAAQVSNQIANLSPYLCILVLNQGVEVIVHICVVNRLVKVLGDSCELRNQAECVDDQRNLVVLRKELVLVDSSKAPRPGRTAKQIAWSTHL